MSANGLDGVILGLSGGIDSAVTCVLATRALKDKALALIMPDSKISPKSETEDALRLVDKTRTEYKLVDINPIIGSYQKYLEPNNRAEGNLRARIRSDILYYYANAKRLMVLGSSDKSEWLTGYFTKFGDGAADILPIVSLYKTQIRKLAEYLKIPQGIITKKSSPYLWENQLAETELGVSYEEIDVALYCMIDKKMTANDAAVYSGIEISKIEKIQKMNKASEHKRRGAMYEDT